jgi:phytoene/squalene synthetase
MMGNVTIDPGDISMHFLPARMRRDVRAIANGCREIRRTIFDNAKPGDGCGCGEGGIVELVRDRVAAVYEGREKAQRWEMEDALREHEIPREVMMGFVDACAAEARVTRYATWDALRRHCDGVGGNAAVAVACVLGVAHSDVRENVMAIGRAGQLIDIVRSMKGDVARDRVFVPLADLAMCRYSERELRDGVADERLERVVALQMTRAREALEVAARGLCWLARDTGKLAAATYVSLQMSMVEAIERAGSEALDKPPVLTTRSLRKLPGAWRLARRTADEALPRL